MSSATKAVQDSLPQSQVSGVLFGPDDRYEMGTNHRLNELPLLVTMPLPRTVQGTNQELNTWQHSCNDCVYSTGAHIPSQQITFYWQVQSTKPFGNYPWTIKLSALVFFFFKEVLIDKRGERELSLVIRVGEQSWGNILACQTIFWDGMVDVSSDCYQDEWISGYT